MTLDHGVLQNLVGQPFKMALSCFRESLYISTSLHSAHDQAKSASGTTDSHQLHAP